MLRNRAVGWQRQGVDPGIACDMVAGKPEAAAPDLRNSSAAAKW
jgi:hypothetical protein